jgi:uncharacterized membrane protein YedE/YeeE
MIRVIYTLLGVIFGVTLFKSEAVSWYRIYEMFLFKSFHMYGIIGSAVGVGIILLYVIKKQKAKSITGEQIELQPKKLSKGNIIGGILFGLGWGLVGACPGPIYVLIGAGYSFVFIIFISALAGTWVYSSLREKLPN